MDTLQDKIAVVTGGGSGIGRSIVLALADAGAHVIVSDIQYASAVEAADAARARGVRALAVACNVADREQVGQLADAAFAEFGRVDILCNNAGVSWRPQRGIVDATLDDWRFILDVNLFGVVHGIDAFLPRMRAQPGRKHIVNTASLAGLVPIEGYSIYSCSKAAVVGLSEAIAGELAPHGIGITIVCPGQVPTGLSDNSNRIRASGERVFAPVATPVKDRLSTFAMPSVEPVGAMVCRAILSNQLYLHTMAVPGDLVADRLHTWFGPQTLSPAPA